MKQTKIMVLLGAIVLLLAILFDSNPTAVAGGLLVIIGFLEEKMS